MKKALPVVVTLLALLLAVWMGLPPQYKGNDLRMDDFIDQYYLINGLKRTHGFSDTWKWWTGPWVGYAGHGQEVAFYRPLTSLIWYCEYRAFGPNGVAGFLLVHRLSHVLVCLLALGFLRLVIGHWKALLAVCLWASGMLENFSLPGPLGALHFWKDGPDLWISIALLSMLWCLLNYWRTKRPLYLAGTIFFQLLGISFKEMAYIGPMLAVALLWLEKTRVHFRLERYHWAPLLTLVGIVVAAYLFRGWALQGPGFRFGSNNSWFGRWMINVIAGRPGNLLVLGFTGSLGVALCLLGSANLFQRHFKVGGVFFSLGVLFIAFNDLRSSTPFETLNNFIATSYMTPFWLLPPVTDAFIVMLVVGAWLSYFRQRDPLQLFGFLWIFLAYLPLTTAPITGHALYLPSIGWGIFLSVFLVRLFHKIPWVKSRLEMVSEMA